MMSRVNLIVFVFCSLVCSFIVFPIFQPSYGVQSGNGAIGPGDDLRRRFESFTGFEIYFRFEMSLAPVECGLIALGDQDSSDIPDDVNLISVADVYYDIAQEGHVNFTVVQNGYFLMIIRNIADVSQDFEYYWQWTDPNEGIRDIQRRMMYLTIIFLPFIILSVILYKRNIKKK